MVLYCHNRRGERLTLLLNNKIVIEIESQFNIREPTGDELNLFKKEKEEEIFKQIKGIFGEPFKEDNEYLKIQVKIKKNKLVKEKEEK